MENPINLSGNIAGPRDTALLSRIPQVQRLLEHAQAERLCLSFGREPVAAALRAELDKARAAIRSGAHALPHAGPDSLADSLPDFFSPAFFEAVEQALLRRCEPRFVRVINATGVVLHTNLGRAPLAPQALEAIAATAAGYSNLEFDLQHGQRGSRQAHVEQLLCELTGAEAALAVNNCAAAVLLMLTALARGGEVLASRGELIEIGGSFRMPDVIAQSGARLVEVGATNKTRLSDYARAINDNTRMMLKSHPSNYRIVGFSASPERGELARLADEKNLVFAEDLGSGTLVDLRRYGLPHEPTVQECLRAGAHVVSFSGDKLLGGPQAGIIVGRKRQIEELKRHPLLRALRIDKLSLAALEATLLLYRSPVPPEQGIPVLRMLSEKKEALARRARRLARALRSMDGVACRVEDGVAYAGGGSLPGTELPGCVVSLRMRGQSAERLARRLRAQRPALIGRIAGDCLLLDLRTVSPREAREIPALIAGAAAWHE